MHFSCVLTYSFGFHHKQRPGDWEDFSFVKFTTQLRWWVLKGRNASATALRWFAGETVHFCVHPYIHIRSAVKPVDIFMARSRVSKSHLKGDLCFHCYVHFSCVPIYIYIYIYILNIYILNIYTYIHTYIYIYIYIYSQIFWTIFENSKYDI